MDVPALSVIVLYSKTCSKTSFEVKGVGKNFSIKHNNIGNFSLLQFFFSYFLWGRAPFSQRLCMELSILQPQCISTTSNAMMQEIDINHFLQNNAESEEK